MPETMPPNDRIAILNALRRAADAYKQDATDAERLTRTSAVTPAETMRDRARALRQSASACQRIADTIQEQTITLEYVRPWTVSQPAPDADDPDYL